ncbi:MAG: hypothetical protein KDN18_08515 [Verrucomicrobiae bacterium]|nr:hypothetical protein [Verrucomicrobiae bacterium]
MNPRCLVAAIGFLLLAHLEAGDDPVRDAVARALPYLEEEGTWWIEEKKCVSCHHTSFFVWAKELALEAGFPVDPAVLDQQREWTWQSFLTEIQPDPKRPENKPKPGEVNGDRNVEGVAQFLISSASSKAPKEVIASLREIVSSNQGDDGNWSPGGQLPRQQRPAIETQWSSNQWAELALKLGGKSPSRETSTWKEGVPSVSREWQMLNLMLRPQNPRALGQLLELQNEDGGWSWKDGEESDPSGTGQALIALGRSGRAKDHPGVVKRAQEFLVRSQREDGSWETMSTKDRGDSGRVSDFWGSAWAVIGLLETSPRERPASAQAGP